jgi:hypothetical protein
MSQRIDERAQTILYHALGADFKQGLALFEKHFAAAEADFQIKELETLLFVLGDNTLHNMQRPAWYHYYLARMAYQQWNPTLVEEHLHKAVIDESQRLLPVQSGLGELLETRKTLLNGKNRILQGDWSVGISLLEQAGISASAQGESSLQLEAQQAKAATYIAWARADGGWQEPAGQPLIRWLERLLMIFLLPLYLVLWIILKARRMAVLSKPAWRYGMYYSNWPIFWYYQQAYRSLSLPLGAEADLPSSQVFRSQMMKADLLHRLLADRLAQEIYQRERDLLPERANNITRYRKAQILLGMGRMKIQSKQYALARQPLSEARGIFASLQDWNSWAYCVLLLGQIAMLTGTSRIALRNYTIAAQVFRKKRDLAGLSETLECLYEFGQSGIPAPLVEPFRRVMHSIQPKTFTVRMPGRLFEWLQLASWLLPVAVLLGLASVISYLIIRAPVTGLESLWQAVISWQALFVFIGVWLGVGLVQMLLGLVGLASALQARRMSLDYITVGQEALEYRSTLPDRSAILPWGELEAYLSVERGWWGKPGEATSFEHLHSAQIKAILLPGTTNRYQELQQAVRQKVTLNPQLFHLNRIGIEILVLVLLSAIVFLGAFALAQRPLPQLNVSIRAWLAATITLFYYFVLLAITSRWVTHFFEVAYATAGNQVKRLSWITAALALAWIGVGLVLKPALMMWSPLVVGWGVLLLISLLLHSGILSHLTSKSLQLGLRAGIYLLAVLLLMRLVLPISINLYAFTYFGAASGYASGYPMPPPSDLRSEYFRHMRLAGIWMNRIDSTHPFAYAYLGYAEYWDGQYDQSLAFYERGMRSFTPFQAPPDFDYCRALAYSKMGASEQTSRACASFNAAGTHDTNCERLFPEESGVCKGLP